MATMTDLKSAFLMLDESQQEEIIRAVRASRFVPKKAHNKTEKKRREKTPTITKHIKTLAPETLEAVIAKMEAMMKEGKN